MDDTTVDQAEIEKLAYELWEQEGRPEGRDLVHYHEAERLLRERALAQQGTGVTSAGPPKARAPRKKRRASPKTRKP